MSGKLIRRASEVIGIEDGISFKSHSFKHDGLIYLIEFLSSPNRLNTTDNHDLFATLAIYQDTKMVYHEVYKQPLTEDQMKTGIDNIVKNPHLYIN